MSLSSLSTSPETASPYADAGSGAKIWEAFCCRCGEEGNLFQCNCSLYPKAYQPLCVGKDTWPMGKWGVSLACVHCKGLSDTR